MKMGVAMHSRSCQFLFTALACSSDYMITGLVSLKFSNFYSGYLKRGLIMFEHILETAEKLDVPYLGTLGQKELVWISIAIHASQLA